MILILYTLIIVHHKKETTNLVKPEKVPSEKLLQPFVDLLIVESVDAAART